MSNIITNTIAKTFALPTPPAESGARLEEMALLMSLTVLRGGTATFDELTADADAWFAEYGEPTRAKLDRWAAELDIEANIAAVALRVRHEGRSKT